MTTVLLMDKIILLMLISCLPVKLNRTFQINIQSLFLDYLYRYDCSPNEEDKVAVYVNEELITLPVSGCTNGICPVSALSNEWLPTTRTCDVEEICDVTNVNTAAKATAPFAALMMSLVATIYIAM